MSDAPARLGTTSTLRPVRAADGARHGSARLVTLKAAGVQRGGRWLVRGIDLAVAEGEIVALIGPNGSGKSTTARIASGVLVPDEGDAARQPGLRIGYVPQKVHVDRTLPMTVDRLMRLTASHQREAVAAALGEVGIAHLARAEIHTLSGGEFQRALLARALVGRPRLLVLDEPLQGVDPAGEAALYGLIGRLRERTGCGALLVSHDLDRVMGVADRIVCLDRGRVRCAGTPQEVAASPDYRALFGLVATTRQALDEPGGGKVRHA